MAANSMPRSDEQFRRAESRKSGSWGWDGHICPKNSGWLSDNVNDMDRNLKHMSRLTQEDADSFAKRADMYYQKRPLMISLVWEFFLTYRALVERYDHVTVELRKNIRSLQRSRVSDHISEPEAAGSGVFLGAGGSSSGTPDKEGDESEPVSDDSPVYRCSGRVSRKMKELENELREAKEKVFMKKDNAEGSFPFKGQTDENSDDAVARQRMAGYEEALRNANEKLRISDIEIMRLKSELQKYEKSGLTQEDGIPSVINVEGLVEELKTTKQKLENSQKELSKLKLQLENNKSPEKICHLPDELEAARKDTPTWKDKLSAARREVFKLQERFLRLKARDQEIRDLILAVSDAEQKNYPEKVEIKAETSQLLEEGALLMEQLRKWEHLNVERTKNLKSGVNGFQSERDQLHAEVITLKENLSSKDKQLNEISEHEQKLEREHEQLAASVEKAERRAEELRLREIEGAEEKREAIRQLCFSIEHYRSGYHMLREVLISHGKSCRL